MKHRAGSAFLIFSLFSTALLLLSGCARTFLVAKDCYSAFLDGNDEKLTRMLCDTGDFRKILDTGDISGSAKDNLYDAVCVKRAGDDVRRAYTSLTKQEQEGLKLSFEKHGYDINYKPVEATGAARITGLRENLPCPAQGPGY